MAKDIFLSVVIPSYDEMANLQKGVLDKVIHFLQKKKISFEVIVVDDGSTDGSIEFVEKFTKENPHTKIIKNGHTGKAGAVTAGMLAASGKYILFADMDQATPIEEIDKLLPFFDQGYDIVIGSRKNRRKGSPLGRVIMSRAWMMLRNMVIGLGIEDTQCGFKMFSNKAAKRIFTKMETIHHGFDKVSGSSVSAGFDVELLYIGKLMGFKIKEVPVSWLYVETRRVNPIRESIEGINYLMQIKQNKSSGKYL